MSNDPVIGLAKRVRTQETMETMLVGAGSPDGVVDAGESTLYYDLTSNDVWVNIDGATDWVIIGGSSTMMDHARATSDNGQNIANDAWQTVIYEDEEYDDGGEYNPATGEFTADRDGRLHIDAAILFENTTAWAPTEVAAHAVFVNGVRIAVLDRQQFHANHNHHVHVQGSTTLEIDADDVVTIRIYQNSGGALGLHTDADYNYVNFDWLL